MTDSSNHSKIKKSVVLSGLVGTGGLFIAKLIGIVYAIPFSSILSNSNYMGYYGQAYNIYSYVLNVFTAGFPFAIATMVAKYATLKDAKTVLLIKRISLAVLLVMGFLGMVLLGGLAGVLAPMMVAGDAKIMANVIRILAIAIFLVPTLSAFRGYYQGLKEMEEYAFSQAFEQLFRVGFLLSVSCLIVYVLGMDRKWALYASVLSTSVAAFAGIIQIVHFDRKKTKEVETLANQQTTSAIDKNKLIKELFILAIPYFISSILGYSQSLYNSILLPTGLKMHYSSTEEIATIISATTYVGVKMTAIPMVLAPGFTAAIIPHITSALTKKNFSLIRKNVVDCLNVVLFIGLPVSFCIFLYAQGINYTLFYTDDIPTSTMVLEWLTIEAITGTIMPVIIALLMALELRKVNLKNLAINAIIKGVLMVPMTYALGYGGAVLASFIADAYLCLAGLWKIKKMYGVNYKEVYQVLIKLGICLLVMWAVSTGLTAIGLGGITSGKMVAFIKMCFNGLFTMIAFGLTAIALKLPQQALHIEIKLPRRHS